MRCRNGQEHTHDTAAQARACWDVQVANEDTVAMGVRGRDMRTLVATAPVATIHVANGHYAVTLAGEDKIRFFRVTAGHKPGVTFVDEQAGSDMWPVAIRSRRVAILATIAADSEAMARYGQTLGVCGRCGRTLTDEASRAAGMGPTCRSK